MSEGASEPSKERGAGDASDATAHVHGPLKDLSTQIEALQRENEEILRPLTLALEATAGRVADVALSAVHKLVTHRAVHPSRVVALVRQLAFQADANLAGLDMASQLKLLQTVVALLTPELYTIHGDTFNKALCICFRLHSSKIASLHQPAEASLRQVVALLFDHLQALQALKDKEKLSSPAPKAEADDLELGVLDGSRLLRDICALSLGQPPVWLTVVSLREATFGWELLEEILSHCPVLTRIPELSTILRDRIGPLVVQVVSTKRESLGASFSGTLRLLRLVAAYLLQYADLFPEPVPVLVESLGGFLDHPALWVRALTLEVLRSLLHSAPYVFSVVGRFDFAGSVESGALDPNASASTPNKASVASKLPEGVSKVFEGQINRLGKFVQTQLAHTPAEDFALPKLPTKGRFLDQLAHSDVSGQIGAAYLILTATQCFAGLVDLLGASIQATAPSDAQASTVPGVQSLAEAIALLAWPAILSTLSLVLAKSKDDALTAVVLKAYQSFTQTCGVLHLSPPRDHFLASLCRFAKPPSSVVGEAEGAGAGGGDGARVGRKSAQAMRALLNSAHSLAPLLPESSWVLVLDTVNAIYVALAQSRARRASEGLAASDGPSPPTPAPGPTPPLIAPSGTSNAKNEAEWASREEEEALWTAEEALFAQPHVHSDSSLLHLIAALIAHSRAKLVELQTTGPVVALRAVSLWGVGKLFQILRSVPPLRLPLVWDPIAAHVVTVVCNHKNPDVRAYGSRELCGVVEEALAALANPAGPFAALAPSDPLLQTLYDMQTPYFEAMEQMCRNIRPEVRRETLESLHRLLLHSGQLLSSAWVIVLPILMAIGLDSSDTQLIPVAFKSLQLIVGDYLPTLPVDCVSLCITTIGCFGGKAITDININISAIGLLWNLGDFLMQHRHKIDFLADLLASSAGLASRTASEASALPSGLVESEGSSKSYLGTHLRARAMSTAAVASLPPEATAVRSAPVPSAALRASTSSPQSVSLGLVDSLWVALFQELWARADNRRAEIRNCALQTLYSALTSYGSANLSPPTWLQLLDQIFIPSLQWAVKNADKADRAVVTAMHHSRNSEAKQWHETQVILLTGSVRVFKQFIDTFVGLSNFGPTWRALVGAVGPFFRSDPEVAIATVGTVKEILLGAYASLAAQAQTPAPSTASSSSPPQSAIQQELEELIRHAWREWQRLARDLRGQAKVPPKALATFADALLDLSSKLQRSLSPLDIHRLLSLAGELSQVSVEFAGEQAVLEKQLLGLLAALVDPRIARALPASAPSSPATRPVYHQHGGAPEEENKSVSRVWAVTHLVGALVGIVAGALGLAVPAGALGPPLTGNPHLAFHLDLAPSTGPTQDPTEVPSASQALAGLAKSLRAPRPEGLARREVVGKKVSVAEGALRVLGAVWRTLGANFSPLAQPSPFLTEEERVAVYVLPELLAVMGQLLQARAFLSQAYPKFCSAVVDLFLLLVQSGLPLFNLPALSSVSDVDKNLLWSSVIDTVEAFLVGGLEPGLPSRADGSGDAESLRTSCKLPTAPSLLNSSREMVRVGSSGQVATATGSGGAEESEEAMVSLLAQWMIPTCPALPLLHERLFGLLLDGASKVISERMMGASYDAIFALLAADQTPALAAPHTPRPPPAVLQLLLPQVLVHCREVLKRFVSDDKQTGALPLPHPRVVEVCAVLSHLAQLRATHLEELYSELCECITARESGVKGALKKVFQALRPSSHRQ